jgi:hypothetical protein
MWGDPLDLLRRWRRCRLALGVVVAIGFLFASPAAPAHRARRPPSSRPMVSHIPPALASAIRAKLGPVPLGMGHAPLLAGIAAAPGGWRAYALSGRLQAHVNPTGRLIVRLAGQRPVLIRLLAVSQGGSTVTLSTAADRLEDGRLIENFKAVRSGFQVTPGGLEQRFLVRRPSGEHSWPLRLGFTSNTRWRVVDHGSGIALGGGGRSRLAWRGLRTTDAVGRLLRSRFILAAHGPEIVVDSRGARYPLAIDPTWTSTSTPTAVLSNGDAEDQVGASVAIAADGTTAAVGAPGANNTFGTVYIFHATSEGAWSSSSTPAATLTSGAGYDGAAFGYQVAISSDGTTVLVGAFGTGATTGVNTGAAYVYHVASEGSWATTSVPTAVLTNSAGQKFDEFGGAVALSADGTTALIGATGAGSGAGAAYVYHVASEGSWATSSVPSATLTNASAGTGTNFGVSVALAADGKLAMVGASGVSSGHGAVYVFAAGSESSWATTTVPTATLTNSAGANGDDLGFALALSPDGTTAAAGAIGQGSAGAVDIYQVPSASSWTTTSTVTATLSEPTGAGQSNFGESVAISNDKTAILVGAYDGRADGAGAAYVYEAPGGSWSSSSTPAATLSSTAAGSKAAFGRDVALAADGTVALIGAPGAGETQGLDVGSGAAYIYHADSESSWGSSSTATAALTNGHSQGVSFDYFGAAVAISADGLTALVGAPGTNSERGAAYVFHVSSTGAWKSTTTATATLTYSAGAASDNFGAAVALSPDGTTALIGAYGVSGGAGAAYVYFASSASAWLSTATPAAILSNSADAPRSGDDFAIAVALSGDGTTALIGDDCASSCTGAADIFQVASEAAWSGTMSTPKAVLSNGAGAADNYFGYPVALSGDGTTALIGDDCASSCTGAADIFHVSTETAWTTTSTPSAVLTNSTDVAGDAFGDAVAISSDGTVAAIGDYYYPDGSSGTGGAFIYTASSESQWTTTAAPTATLVNPTAVGTYDQFGGAIALAPEGTSALVGAGAQAPGGAAYLYQVSSESAWSAAIPPTATITDSGLDDGDEQFGAALALSSQANVALIGAYNCCNVNGVALVYEPQQPVKASPSISTAQQPASATVGSSIADQATVSGGDHPTGTVTFNLYDNPNGTGTPLFTDANEPLSGGTASSGSYTTSATGTDYWVATYNGDANNNPVSSTNAGEPVKITPASPSVSVSAPSTGTAGQAIAAPAIQASLSGGFSPSGTITFVVFGPQSSAPSNCTSGGTTVGDASVSKNGSYHPSAAFTPPTPGDYWWYASYGGDANNSRAASTCGAAMTETVVSAPRVSGGGGGGGGVGPKSTSTVLSSSPNPSLAGQPVTFTATISPAPDGGTVRFTDPGTTIAGCGVVPVSSTGQASCTTTLTAPGSYQVQAIYSGDALYATSQSAVFTQVVEEPGGTGGPGGPVGPRSTSTALSSSADPSVTGQRVIYAASISPAPDGGSVSFSSDRRPIAGCIALPVSTSGRASCETVYGAAGSRAIQVFYTGDSRFAASRSAVLTQRVLVSATLRGRPSGRALAVRFTLACASRSGGCHIAAKLTSVVSLLGKKVVALSASAHHRRRSLRTLVIGKLRLTIAAGKIRGIVLKLNRSGRKLLAKFGKLPLTLTITLSADGQTSTIATIKVTLEPPPARERRGMPFVAQRLRHGLLSLGGSAQPRAMQGVQRGLAVAAVASGRARL